MNYNVIVLSVLFHENGYISYSLALLSLETSILKMLVVLFHGKDVI